MTNAVVAAGPWLLVAAFAVVVGAVAYFSWLGERTRRDSLRRIARSRGWTFEAEDASLVHEWDGPPFDTGSSRRARNVVGGVHRGRRFLVFDYSYETSSGVGAVTVGPTYDRTTTSRYVVTALALPVALPGLQVVPESLLTRLATGTGLLQDVDVESDAFNQRFRVFGSSAKFASDVLNPRQIEALLQAVPTPWRFADATALCWREGEMEASDVDRDVGFLSGIVERVPRFVWLDRGYDPDSPD